MKRYPNPSFVTAMFIHTKYFDLALIEALDRKSRPKWLCSAQAWIAVVTGLGTAFTE